MLALLTSKQVCDSHTLAAKLNNAQKKAFEDVRSIEYIPHFIEEHRLDVSDLLVPVFDENGHCNYKNFNEFFFRKVQDLIKLRCMQCIF